MDFAFQNFPQNSLASHKVEAKSSAEEKVAINSFSLICVIGKGSYAKVIVARKRDTGKIYALKVIKKSKVEQSRNKDFLTNERSILIEIQHPFIIKMSYTFQNERKLYFALEYCPGGELFNLLQKKRRFSEEHAKFYAVQVLLALEHIHNYDVVYKDLKPENILIDEEGYIRLVDFGLAKRGIKANEGIKSDSGTPEYLAPEILFRVEHGKPVDWWTLGAFIYEMLTGLPPFYSADREELFFNIKNKALAYPNYMSPCVKDLLERLLQKDPVKRIGTGPDDAKEIKAHPWFKNVNWEAFLKKEVKAPYVPILKNELDLSNFDPEFTEIPIESFGENIFDQGQSYTGWSYNASESFKTSLKV